MDREDAGLKLAMKLRKDDFRDPLVLALPRGGVPVAAEIAAVLNAPLDILVVRKIGLPGHLEFGVGAITENGFYRLNRRVLRRFGLDVTDPELQKIVQDEKEEVARRIEKYRSGRQLPSMRDREVLLVDDGMATGITAEVGTAYLKELGAQRVILAIPVCAKDSAEALSSEVDKLVCLESPEAFFSVGRWYENFSQVSDEEVLSALDKFQQAA